VNGVRRLPRIAKRIGLKKKLTGIRGKEICSFGYRLIKAKYLLGLLNIGNIELCCAGPCLVSNKFIKTVNTILGF
jgi:hypothetical protein